jgi:hypothetical protein
LDDQIGVQIVKPNARGIESGAAGQIFLEHAKKDLLGVYQVVKSEAAGLACIRDDIIGGREDAVGIGQAATSW